ncbi:metallopeptidase TldD-related protein [uncultured Piscinibacter sp.]|uniref:metallopeptidase TldD-related protein n=1 Tax=uncultured Piscinibacter sp. TaxID=1131835 RepID=UPI0026311717|nr:metallopeptidase TldD-related protein [uncultured Piscinibacter sp.]
MSGVSRDHFDALAETVCNAARAGERSSLLLSAESSDFVRFNRAAVRQATHVEQAMATVALTRGRRRAESRITLTGRLDTDRAALLRELEASRAVLPDLCDDPYLLLPETPLHSVRHETGTLPSAAQLVEGVCAAAAGLDFVGFYAGGPLIRAFADSLGTRHWHHVECFHFDWCLYHAADKAVKAVYAGAQWHGDEFARRVAESAAQLGLLARPPRTLQPGAYRAWFAPTAVAELLGALSWGGFGLKARRTGTSSLMRLAHRDEVLHPDVSLFEHTAHGSAPAFTSEGFSRPEGVSLVERGLATGTLANVRSAQEYGVPANGANAQEYPESLSLLPGRVPAALALAALGTGIWVSNLWYLNYSDRQACRMTGLTRFACLWVEEGQPVAPIGVMRFDDSFLRMFGTGLVGLGDRAELIAESGTYLERQLGSTSTPGALVDGWKLTL